MRGDQSEQIVAVVFTKLDHALDIARDRVNFEVDPILRLEVLQGRYFNGMRDEIDADERATEPL